MDKLPSPFSGFDSFNLVGWHLSRDCKTWSSRTAGIRNPEGQRPGIQLPEPRGFPPGISAIPKGHQPLCNSSAAVTRRPPRQSRGPMGDRSRAPPLGGQERLRVGLSISWRLHRPGACQGRFPGASLAQSASRDGACGNAELMIIPVIIS